MKTENPHGRRLFVLTEMDVNTNPPEKEFRDYLNATGMGTVDKDIQNKLREILNCAICYEIPKGKDLKVRICEQGHHFCTGCYKYLKHCGICRGRFLMGRNFAVEEIITQLGPSFGLSNVYLPAPEENPEPVSGIYDCLHQCPIQLKAVYMLNHIRSVHSKNLFDNVRSNPYLKVFDSSFDVSFTPNQHAVSSFQVSDMGLFTVVINISDKYVLGSVHMLGNVSVLSNFQYKLSVKINKTGHAHEFSISDCDLFYYSYNLDAISQSEKCLKLDVNNLLKLISFGDCIQIFLSIWRNKKEISKNNFIQRKRKVVTFASDRKQRRNRKRNERKKKLRQMKREKDNEKTLIEIFDNLFLSE